MNSLHYDTPVRDSTASTGEEKHHTFTVHKDDKRSRLDLFLADKLRAHGISREKIKSLIQAGRVSVDSCAALSVRMELLPGNTVCIVIPATSPCLHQEEGDISVLYKDSELAIINKPAGLTMHPAPGLISGTLVHRLLSHFPELRQLEGLRPGIVHRLDKDTTGLLLIALTERSRLALVEQFSRHEVIKEYLALVYGVPQEEGSIEAPIGRHPTIKTRMAVSTGGKTAKSSWRRLYADPLGRFSLLAVRIFSGRTHQIRVHMQHLGHPLLGDVVYKNANGTANILCEQSLALELTKNVSTEAGSYPKSRPSRQMLHAWKLAFKHPFPNVSQTERNKIPEPHGGFISFLCPPPEDFTRCLHLLLQHPFRVVITGAPGCGKSALLNFLIAAGMPVFSADAEITRLYQPGGDGHRLLQLHYGNRFVPDPSRAVDKQRLSLAMNQSETLRREVEHLVHPLVWHALEYFWQEQGETYATMAFAEIPLYLESGQRDVDDKLPPECKPLLIGVNCPFSLRKERLQQNRGWSQETIAFMESWQWPEEIKMKACDLVLENSSTIEGFHMQATLLIKKLIKMREEHITKNLGKIQSLWNHDC